VVFASSGQLDLAVEFTGEVRKVPDGELDALFGAVILNSVDVRGVRQNEVLNVLIIVDEIDASLKVVSACLGHVSHDSELSCVVVRVAHSG